MTGLAQWFGLEGRRALITGSSRGLGLVMARALAEAGAEVVLNGRDAARLDEAARALSGAAGTRVQTAAFDITDEAAIGARVDEIGPLDILVNNAGIHQRAPLTEMTLSQWNAVVHTNLTGAFLVARAFVPPMLRRGRGKVINVTSVNAQLARPSIANYCASKGGLQMLTRAMAIEWSGRGIQVNALAPGYMKTELTERLVADPEFDAWIRGRTPAGRWGDPEDLMGATVFLASRASDYVTGQTLFVDGGIVSGL